MRHLLREYRTKKGLIKKRLKEFDRIYKAKDEDIFCELCFCLLTPQSKAINCDKAIRTLKKSKLLFKGSPSQIGKILKGLARFHNKKALFLVAARNLFRNGKNKLDIKVKLDKSNVLKTREWLVDNIKGLGYKEASHFLRNIGMGKDLAILDVHILKNLKRYGVINKIPKSISKKDYLEIEQRIIDFSKKTKIPPEELDLLFWSHQTGFIFK